MITHLYQSAHHENWYLVLPIEDDLTVVPQDILTQLGELVKIQSAEVGPGSLGIDLLQAKSDFDTQGYHLAKPLKAE